MAITCIPISAVDDPRVADFHVISDPALMRERGLFVVEGGLAVERLLTSRFRTRALLLTETALDRLAPALDRRASAAVPDESASSGAALPPDLYLTGSQELRRITGFRFHRGCLALGERPAPAAAGVSPPAPRPGRPVVALERVSDPDNVGAIFRNAAAFGVAAVVLSPGCADPLYRKAIRTSIGATLTVPFITAEAWPAALRRIGTGRPGVRTAALTPTGPAVDVDVFARRAAGGPVVLVVGNEGDGLSPPAIALCDERVRIDVAPAVDSLNVAVAAAIALQRLRTASVDAAP